MINGHRVKSLPGNWFSCWVSLRSARSLAPHSYSSLLLSGQDGRMLDRGGWVKTVSDEAILLAFLFFGTRKIQRTYMKEGKKSDRARIRMVLLLDGSCEENSETKWYQRV